MYNCYVFIFKKKVLHACNSALWRLRNEDGKFRPGWATEPDPVNE
jgi:hypothetical protein